MSKMSAIMHAYLKEQKKNDKVRDNNIGRKADKDKR